MRPSPLTRRGIVIASSRSSSTSILAGITLDTDPDHPALDKSCMAEAEGPYRYARGHAYVAAMQARDNGTPNHSAWDVPGIGHEGGKMLTSPCGLTALFDIPGCAAAR